MYSECGDTQSGAKLNCKYTGEAKSIPQTSNVLFKEMCPHLFKNSADNETYTCCDATQIERLNNGFSLPRQLMSHCPSCFLNFKTFLCDIICSPNQSDFLIVTSERAYTPQPEPEIEYIDFNFEEKIANSDDNRTNSTVNEVKQLEVVRLTYHLTNQYVKSFYDSCK